MTDTPVAAIKGLGVNLIQASYTAHQVGLRLFEQQVVVVAHEAPGVAAPALLLDLSGEEIDEALAIPVIGENQFARIAAGRDVVNRTGEFEIKRAG